VSPTRLLWAIAVVLAVAVVVGMVYGRRGDGEPKTTVMVAKQLIPAGTYVVPGTFEFVTVPQDEVVAGTLTDIRYLAYYSVAHPIYPGERFRTSDFSPTRGR
jgi:Flp pilus assembly protein CpaB